MSQHTPPNSPTNSDLEGSLAELWEETDKALTPTENAINQVLSTEELIKLCKQFPCKVQMESWNLANDIYRFHKKKGKFDNKSPKKINKLIVKAANRMKCKSKYIYNQEEIENIRHSEWRARKFQNIIWLNYEKTQLDDSMNDIIATSSTESVLEEGSPRKLVNEVSLIFNTNSIPLSVITETFSEQSENYKKFIKMIPSTSTQSQEEEKEEGNNNKK